MKKWVLTFIVALLSSNAFASGMTKLSVSCSDAPQRKRNYYADVVRYYQDRLVLEAFNATLGRYEIKSVLPYKKCTIQGVSRQLQQQ